jgi:hypothetical protein
LGEIGNSGDFSKKTESYKLKIFEADSALLVEREKFKNLQEMAIADKEKCVQFELKATQLGNFFPWPMPKNSEMDSNSKDISLQERGLEIWTLAETVSDLEQQISLYQRKESSFSNNQKISNLELDLSEYFESNYKSQNYESNVEDRDGQTLEKMIHFQETLKSLQATTAKNESEFQSRNQALRCEVIFFGTNNLG